MRILVIGQCSLHIGRMEFGNIGNFYIIEPFFRELHRAFPGAEIRTTLQMSDDFCRRENVTRLPMSLYYGWTDSDLETSMQELKIAEEFRRTGNLKATTPYIEEVAGSDLVVDFSGDIWGDNADFLGPERFLVGLRKDRVAQILGKKTAMLAGSPGPFKNPETLDLAKEVFSGFDLVTNREAVSRPILQQNGFDTSRLHDLACPAFLFEPDPDFNVEALFFDDHGMDPNRPIVGFIVCGWNFSEGPFDKWPRPDHEYEKFAEAVESIAQNTDAQICLMSHSNGFITPAPPFDLIHGRDFPIANQLHTILENRGNSKDVFLLDGIYSAWETKTIIGKFDMLVSGRVHGAVAGLSQSVPSVIIDYGHEPKAHKLRGFAELAGAERFFADPSKEEDLREKILLCWQERVQVRMELDTKMSETKPLAKRHFDLLQGLMDA